MPFRYVKDKTGRPIMPDVSPLFFLPVYIYLHTCNIYEDSYDAWIWLTPQQGMIDLVKKDADKSFEDFL